MKKAVKKALEKIRKTHGKALKRLAESDTMSKKDIALHLREQTKRTDLPDDVIRAMADAYYEITRLEESIRSSAEAKMPSPFIIGGQQDDPLFMVSCVTDQYSFRNIQIDVEWSKRFVLSGDDTQSLIKWLTNAFSWIINDKERAERIYKNDPACSWMNAFINKE